MIARVTWGKIKPGKWEQFEKLWNNYAKETATAPGMRGRVLLRCEDDSDSGYGISFWDDASDFEKFRSSTASQTGAMEDCFVGEYSTTVTIVSGVLLNGLA